VDDLRISSENPMILLLNLIWTKLSYAFKLPAWFDHDLGMERASPLLSGIAVQVAELSGWEYSSQRFPQVQTLLRDHRLYGLSFGACLATRQRHQHLSASTMLRRSALQWHRRLADDDRQRTVRTVAFRPDRDSQTLTPHTLRCPEVSKHNVT
jgi:hypothetical protein